MAGIIAVKMAVTIIPEPTPLLNRVVRSALDWTFNTRPFTRLPLVSSNLIDTVASPKTLGISDCQTIVLFPKISI